MAVKVKQFNLAHHMNQLVFVCNIERYAYNQLFYDLLLRHFMAILMKMTNINILL